jgi:hypothetical protein
MSNPSSKTFTDQQLFDWKRAGLNPFEEEQVALLYGPRLTSDALFRYITDSTRWSSPICRAVLAQAARIQELEAALRRELARSGGGNPFAAQEPYQEFPKLKSFWETPASVSLEEATVLLSELAPLMEELSVRREFANMHHAAYCQFLTDRANR